MATVTPLRELSECSIGDVACQSTGLARRSAWLGGRPGKASRGEGESVWDRPGSSATEDLADRPGRPADERAEQAASGGDPGRTSQIAPAPAHSRLSDRARSFAPDPAGQASYDNIVKDIHVHSRGAYVAIRQQEVLQGTQGGSKPWMAATEEGLKKGLRRT